MENIARSTSTLQRGKASIESVDLHLRAMSVSRPCAGGRWQSISMHALNDAGLLPLAAKQNLRQLIYDLELVSIRTSVDEEVCTS